MIVPRLMPSFDCDSVPPLRNIGGFETQIPTDRSLTRVLLVEDESKLRESLVEGMRLENWTVTSAQNGIEARQKIATREFDLIVLDWMLPDCEGVEIVRQLREQGNNVPVLLMTARGGSTARNKVIQAGANDFLAKPFAFDDLLARSRALLRDPRSLSRNDSEGTADNR